MRCLSEEAYNALVLKNNKNETNGSEIQIGNETVETANSRKEPECESDNLSELEKNWITFDQKFKLVGFVKKVI